MRQIFTTLVATSLLCACASVVTPTEPREEKEVMTGSNIPRKERNSAVTVLPASALKSVQESGGGPTTRGGENIPSR
jgi:uncharacterized protein YceK